MKKILVIILVGLGICAPVFGEECLESFSWDQNSDGETIGYIILYGIAPDDYSNEVDVGNPDPINGRCSGDVPNLICGESYHLVVIAYSASGERSSYSNEVSIIAGTSKPDPLQKPSPPQEFRVVE